MGSSSLPVPDWVETDSQQPLRSQETQGAQGNMAAERFRTPESWGDKEPVKGSGERSEGPLLVEKNVRKETSVRGEELEREMEAVMFEQVMEQNRQLKEELEKLKKAQADQQSLGSWSDVGSTRDRERDRRSSLERERTPPPRPPARPPPPSPPSRSRLRYTPNGTEIPSLPPGGTIDDLPEVPPWPYEYQETAEGYVNILGGDAQKSSMGYGWERGEVPTPQEARMKWLETEVETLRSFMQRQTPSGGSEGSTPSGKRA